MIFTFVKTLLYVFKVWLVKIRLAESFPFSNIATLPLHSVFFSGSYFYILFGSFVFHLKLYSIGSLSSSGVWFIFPLKKTWPAFVQKYLLNAPNKMSGLWNVNAASNLSPFQLIFDDFHFRQNLLILFTVKQACRNTFYFKVGKSLTTKTSLNKNLLTTIINLIFNIYFLRV